MTREEAIKILKEERWYMSRYSEEYEEAYNMAIEALNEADKREQYGQNYEADDFVKLGVTDKNKDKVILYDAFGEKEYYPQTDLVRCKDCRHAYFKDFDGYCKHMVNILKPDGFCYRGERREE